jgi:hypothetical protein
MIRRHLLKALLVLAGWLALSPARLPAAATPADSARAAVGRLVEAVPSPVSAAVIGRRYLLRHPEESETGILVAELERRAASRGLSLSGRCGADLAKTLAELRRQDFAAGETACVDGWVLARSEARLYALAALLRPA